MTQDEIIRMAREAGFIHTPPTLNVEREFWSNLERFAALVAAHERDKLEVQFKKMQSLYEIRENQPNKPCCLAEREACAKVCDELKWYSAPINFAENCAKAIRARVAK